MRVPTSCRSMTSDVERRAASRRSARASRCRASRPARGGRSSRAWPVSIMLSCTSDRKPCCGPKMRRQRRARSGPRGDRRCAAARVDRRGVADDADAAALEGGRSQQAVGSQRHAHGRIIEAARFSALLPREKDLEVARQKAGRDHRVLVMNQPFDDVAVVRLFAGRSFPRCSGRRDD